MHKISFPTEGGEKQVVDLIHADVVEPIHVLPFDDYKDLLPSLRLLEI
jgi:hypothetical protein